MGGTREKSEDCFAWKKGDGRKRVVLKKVSCSGGIYGGGKKKEKKRKTLVE